jgi:hypothetical protein
VSRTGAIFKDFNSVNNLADKVVQTLDNFIFNQRHIANFNSSICVKPNGSALFYWNGINHIAESPIEFEKFLNLNHPLKKKPKK